MNLTEMIKQGKKKDRFAFIRALLVLNKIRASEIGDAVGVTRSMVARVINNLDKSRRVQEEIARRLNLPYDELWG